MEIQSVHGSPTYIWYVKDLLGQGAAGSVYKGRHRVRFIVLWDISKSILSSLNFKLNSYNEKFNCLINRRIMYLAYL